MELIIHTTLWVSFAFFCGSLPFSVWIGQIFAKIDIREYGDGNPGATNVLKSTGKFAGLIAVFLDISKGAFPVGLAYFVYGIQDFSIIPIAIAPTFGHAFSPFLSWHGGKAIAVTFGTWIGLTLVEMPLVSLILLVFWFSILESDAWAVLLTLLGMLIYILFFLPNIYFMIILAAQGSILVYRQKPGYQNKPKLRGWLASRIRLN